MNRFLIMPFVGLMFFATQALGQRGDKTPYASLDEEPEDVVLITSGLGERPDSMDIDGNGTKDLAIGDFFQAAVEHESEVGYPPKPSLTINLKYDTPDGLVHLVNAMEQGYRPSSGVVVLADYAPISIEEINRRGQQALEVIRTSQRYDQQISLLGSQLQDQLRRMDTYQSELDNLNNTPLKGLRRFSKRQKAARQKEISALQTLIAEERIRREEFENKYQAIQHLRDINSQKITNGLTSQEAIELAYMTMPQGIDNKLGPANKHLVLKVLTKDELDKIRPVQAITQMGIRVLTPAGLTGEDVNLYTLVQGTYGCSNNSDYFGLPSFNNGLPTFILSDAGNRVGEPTQAFAYPKYKGRKLLGLNAGIRGYSPMNKPNIPASKIKPGAQPPEGESVKIPSSNPSWLLPEVIETFVRMIAPKKSDQD